MTDMQNKNAPPPSWIEPRTYISKQALFYIGYITAVIIIGLAATIVDAVYLIGGVIGLVGGPIGVVTGATAGGLLGYNDDDKEKGLVKRFNKSRNIWRQKER